MIGPTEKVNQDAGSHHEQAQRLPHGEDTPEDQSQLDIRFTEKFDKEPDKAIAEQVGGKEKSVKGASSTDAPENGKQDQTFKEGFVKLRWMAKLMQGIQGEIHSPRHVRHPPIELPVDKVADPAEGIAQGDGGRKKLENIPEGDGPFPAEDQRRQKNADRPSMIGHAADSGEG